MKTSAELIYQDKDRSRSIIDVINAEIRLGHPVYLTSVRGKSFLTSQPYLFGDKLIIGAITCIAEEPGLIISGLHAAKKPTETIDRGLIFREG